MIPYIGPLGHPVQLPVFPLQGVQRTSQGVQRTSQVPFAFSSLYKYFFL